MSSKKSKKSEFIFDQSFFCNKLTQLREEKKLDEAVLEREIGLTRGMWTTYESGKSIPGLNAAVQIAHYWGKSLDELVWQPRAKEIPVEIPTLRDFIDILENLLEIMRKEKRKDIIESLRGIVKDVAERRGVINVAQNMSRQKYAKRLHNSNERGE